MITPPGVLGVVAIDAGVARGVLCPTLLAGVRTFGEVYGLRVGSSYSLGSCTWQYSVSGSTQGPLQYGVTLTFSSSTAAGSFMERLLAPGGSGVRLIVQASRLLCGSGLYLQVAAGGTGQGTDLSALVPNLLSDPVLGACLWRLMSA